MSKENAELVSCVSYLLLVFITLLVLINIFILFIKRRNVLLKSPANTFLFSLLIAHIINNIMAIFLNGIYVINDGTIPIYVDDHTWYTKVLNEAIIALSLIVSVHVVLISLDRYFAIKLHLQYKCWLTKRKQLYALLLTWSIPLVPIITYELISIGIGHDFCNETKHLTLTLMTVSIILASIILVLLLNVYLYQRITGHIKQIKATTIRVKKQHKLKHEVWNKEKKAFYYSFCIVLSFVLAYIPLIATMISMVVHKSVPIELHIVASFMVVLNSVSDGIIYIVKSDIRKEFKKMFFAQ